MGQYCFARWHLSSSSVTLLASGPADRRAADTPRWANGPVWLRPVRATPCIIVYSMHNSSNNAITELKSIYQTVSSVLTAHIWLKNMTPVKIPKITASSISSDNTMIEAVGEWNPAVKTQQCTPYVHVPNGYKNCPTITQACTEVQLMPHIVIMHPQTKLEVVCIRYMWHLADAAIIVAASSLLVIFPVNLG